MRKASAAASIALVASACSSAAPSGGVAHQGPPAPSGSAPGGPGGLVDTDGTGGLDTGCASDVYAGELLPLDMLVMLDRSGSMAEAGKWEAVTGAIREFMSLPDLGSLSLGVQFFPLPPASPPPVQCASEPDCGTYGPCFLGLCTGSIDPFTSCSADDYRTPAAGIAPLPGVAAQIDAAVNAQFPQGSTPMAPALEGAIDYAQAWAAAHPGRAVAVVLATDGEPSTCNPGTVATVAARAAEGFAQAPSVKTFVIGIGQALTSLNEIARQGGTDQALIVTSAGAGQEFLEALDRIRGGLSCSVAIPAPIDGTADPAQVNVAFTPDSGAEEVLPQVASAWECSGEPGWYYDDPSNPSRIELCPASCDLARAQQGTMEVVLGCKTVLR